MQIRFLDLKKQYAELKDEVNAAIWSVLEAAAFVGGPHVQSFEREFADYLGASHVVGVGNGTDALELAIQALEFPPDSEIIVPANSFVASAEAVTNTGHQVVFCDCDPRTLTVSVSDARRRITKKTRAIMAVHLYGHPADMDAIYDLALEHGLKIIEDAAQAHGTRYRNARVGTLGDVAAFSFYPGKNLGAYGDGGAVVTGDENLARRVRELSNHGRTDKHHHGIVGRNSRLDGLQAAVLSVKLKHLDAWNEKRRQVAQWYRAGLRGCGDLILPETADGVEPVFHLFPVQTWHRNLLREHLAARGIETGIHYPVSIPKLKAYEHCGQGSENMFANQVDSRLLSLPMGEHLDKNDVLTVIKAVQDFFAQESPK